jgi:hypothetical protein
VGFLAPSITPWASTLPGNLELCFVTLIKITTGAGANNPSFRVVNMSATTGELMDYRHVL